MPRSGTETTHQRIAMPSSLSSVAVNVGFAGCAALRIVAGASSSVLKPWRTDTLPSALLTNTEIGMACSTPALQAVILPTRASPVAFCTSKPMAAATTLARPVSASSAATGGAGCAHEQARVLDVDRRRLVGGDDHARQAGEAEQLDGKGAAGGCSHARRADRSSCPNAGRRPTWSGAACRASRRRRRC